MKRFFIQSTILTAVVFVVGAILYSTALKPYYHILLPLTLLFFYCTTNLIHAYLLKVAVNSGSRFTSKYMAVNFIKMFSYLIIAVIVAFSVREYAKIFLVNFLVGYIIFTAFETMQFARFVRQKKE